MAKVWISSQNCINHGSIFWKCGCRSDTGIKRRLRMDAHVPWSSGMAPSLHWKGASSYVKLWRTNLKSSCRREKKATSKLSAKLSKKEDIFQRELSQHTERFDKELSEEREHFRQQLSLTESTSKMLSTICESWESSSGTQKRESWKRCCSRKKRPGSMRRSRGKRGSSSS